MYCIIFWNSMQSFAIIYIVFRRSKFNDRKYNLKCIYRILQNAYQWCYIFKPHLRYTCPTDSNCIYLNIRVHLVDKGMYICVQQKVLTFISQVGSIQNTRDNMLLHALRLTVFIRQQRGNVPKINFTLMLLQKHTFRWKCEAWCGKNNL